MNSKKSYLKVMSLCECILSWHWIGYLNSNDITNSSIVKNDNNLNLDNNLQCEDVVQVKLYR